MIQPYEPSNTLSARIARKTLPFKRRNNIRVKLDRPIVSFTFDDFPRTAKTAGGEVLEQHGWRGTFYVSGGLQSKANHHGANFNRYDAKELQVNGHEIGDHTYNHIDCATCTAQELVDDLVRNKSSVLGMAVRGQMQHFAYPYGTASPLTKAFLGSQYVTARGVTPGVNRGKADLSLLKACPIFSGAGLERTFKHIESLKKKPGWLILFTHDIRESPSQWGCTPEDFVRTIEAVKASGAQVLPVGAAVDAIKEMNGEKNDKKNH